MRKSNGRVKCGEEIDHLNNSEEFSIVIVRILNKLSKPLQAFKQKMLQSFILCQDKRTLTCVRQGVPTNYGL